MVSENEAPSSVTNKPREVAPGIPAVEVDPTNELLDGENLDEKKALLADPVANVKVDPSGRRLEDKGAAAAREAGEDPLLVMPPPAAANLELRKRTEKMLEGMYGSIGALPPGEDSTLAALHRERETLQRRADDGDEKAGRRVSQVEESIKARQEKVDADLKAREDAAKARQAAAQEASGTGAKAAESRSEPPKGRSAKPTQNA